MLNELRMGVDLKPRLKHDCEGDGCQFLGFLRVNNVDYDVYTHERAPDDDAHIIARFGNNPSEYQSFDHHIAKMVPVGRPLHYAAQMRDLWKAIS